MPEYNKKKQKWCIGSGKNQKCYKDKATATRSYRAYKAKAKKK